MTIKKRKIFHVRAPFRHISLTSFSYIWNFEGKALVWKIKEKLWFISRMTLPGWK